MLRRFTSYALALPILALCTAAPALAQSPPVKAARTVIYHSRDLVSLRTRLLYTTLIVLPDGEQVVEATCGDKEHWLINVRDGLVSIKPTKAAAETNLNLVATSGQVYAFLLSEISERKEGESGDADLTVYVEREEADTRVTTGLAPSLVSNLASGLAAGLTPTFIPSPAQSLDSSLASGPPSSDAAGEASPAPLAPSPSLVAQTRRPKFVRTETLDDYRAQADLARDQARQVANRARADLDAGLESYRTSYPVSMQFPYRIDSRKTAFRIRAMWHDDHRTFIQTTAHELPALYEYQDRLPALVNFEVSDGTYVVPKVLRDGYLQLGAARLGFRYIEEGQ